MKLETENLGLPLGGCGSGFDAYGHADPDELAEVFGVPVGEAEAAVAFRAANLFGCRGAVDAIAGAVESDPGDTDGIVGAWGDDEAPAECAAFGGFGEYLWIEGVVGILDGGGDGEVADGAFGGNAADAAGEVAEETAAVVEGAEVAPGKADADAGSAARWGPLGIGDDEFGAGADKIPIHGGIQAPDEVWVGAGAFGDEFEDGFVIEGGSL